MKQPKPIAERMELIEGQWVKIKVYAPHETSPELHFVSPPKRSTYQKYRSSQVLGRHP